MDKSQQQGEGPVERARDDWKESTTALERVSQVIESTTTPKTASEVAGEALVSPPTARKHLESLVEVGTATATEDSDATRYTRDEDRFLYRRIRDLATDQTQQELTDGVRRMREQIQAFEATYDVASPADLVSSIDGDQSTVWEDVSEWQSVERNLHIAQAALNYKRARHLGTATQ